MHIPKAKRVQARKAAPRAWKGKLVGYEGDGGHIYKVWDPTTKKVMNSRDIGFPQPGDEDDIGPMPVQPRPDPKGPTDDSDDAVGFIPISLTNDEEDSAPKHQQQVVHTQPVQPTQTPAQQRFVQTPITPSTIHLPTIYGSVSTMPETPREKTQQQKAIAAPPVRQRKLFQTRLPIVHEEPRMSGARLDFAKAPDKTTQAASQQTIQQEASQEATPIHQRRTDFGERLRAFTAQISQLAESMKEVREEADNIERNAITEQSSETATSDRTTPSPERQRADYQYPFSSPQQAPQQSVSTQQASVSPRREIIQAVEIAQDAPSSNENTPVTARSEMSPSREIISIESSPDPITQDPTTPVPPPSPPIETSEHRNSSRAIP